MGTSVHIFHTPPPQHNDHPAFGLAGFALPIHEVRKFNTFFYQLKGNLLRWEIDRDIAAKGVREYEWEKKGSKQYTHANVVKYRSMRDATNRYLRKIKALSGFTFYVGQEKKRVIAEHDPKAAYRHVLKEALKRLQGEFEARNSTFSLVLDEHTERAEILQTVAIQMFAEGITRLVEPPFEADSKLFQSVQCADWICGIVGRMAYYKVEPEDKPGWDVFEKYFGNTLNEVSVRSNVRTFGKPTSEKLERLVERFQGASVK